MIKKRIPLAASQEALYESLSAYQTTKVYNLIPIEAELPYIQIRAFTCKPGGSKDVDTTDITSQIHIFSEYDGELEVNGIANDVIQVISANKLDLSASGFSIMDQGYDFFESFPTKEGYMGIVTFVAKVQNIKI